MNILLRFLAGIVGAIIGALVALMIDLTVGDGVQFVPLSKFLAPLAVGSAIGFVLGFTFYKATGKLFGFLGCFGTESSS